MTGSQDYEFNWKLNQLLREVISETDGINIREAEPIAFARALELIDLGELKPPSDLLAAAVHAGLRKADRRDGDAADKVLERIANGEDALDLDGDPGLELVVDLGAGLRKSLGDLQTGDLLAKDALKKSNIERARVAYDVWLPTMEKVTAGTREYGTVRAAMDAGAFRNPPE